jgi:predicted DNA-binding transcriptional regulator AlpA
MEITFENLPQAVNLLTNEVTDLKRLLLERNKNPDSPPDISDPILTVKEVGKLLSITSQSVYVLMKRREIPWQKRKKLAYFFLSDILLYLKEGRQKTQAEIDDMAEIYLQKKKVNAIKNKQ